MCSRLWDDQTASTVSEPTGAHIGDRAEDVGVNGWVDIEPNLAPFRPVKVTVQLLPERIAAADVQHGPAAARNRPLSSVPPAGGVKHRPESQPAERLTQPRSGKVSDPLEQAEIDRLQRVVCYACAMQGSPSRIGPHTSALEKGTLIFDPEAIAQMSRKTDRKPGQRHAASARAA